MHQPHTLGRASAALAQHSASLPSQADPSPADVVLLYWAGTGNPCGAAHASKAGRVIRDVGWMYVLHQDCSVLEHTASTTDVRATLNATLRLTATRLEELRVAFSMHDLAS